MRFLLDVHIAISIAKRLTKEGFDTQHVNRLPDKWHTPDGTIASIADREDRILITKDSDFRDSCLLHGTPRKLIKINLGNIPNEVLVEQLMNSVDQLAVLNERGRFLVEVDMGRLSVVDLAE